MAVVGQTSTSISGLTIGLAIVRTERHSRVDRQLRGRSGRQGDPGVPGFLFR